MGSKINKSILCRKELCLRHIREERNPQTSIKTSRKHSFLRDPCPSILHLSIMLFIFLHSFFIIYDRFLTRWPLCTTSISFSCTHRQSGKFKHTKSLESFSSFLCDVGKSTVKSVLSGDLKQP